MSAAFIERSLPALFDRLKSVLGEEVLIVNPSRAMIAGLVEWGVERPDAIPHVRLLAEEWTLKNALGNFTIASRAADMIEADRLQVRFVPDPPKSALIADGDRAIAVLEAGEHVGGLESTEASFVGELFEENVERFQLAEDYRLHTPPISTIEATLEERMGDDRRSDFVALVEQLDGRDGPIDEVIISLLVASKNRDLLYDISKWGEDIGLASKATFSRKKSELEDAGVIDTEKEYIDVGRPRLRLKFADDSLEDAPPEAILERVFQTVA